MPVSFEMHNQRDTSDQPHLFLVPSRVSTSRRSISGCSQSSIPSNLCAMASMMLTNVLQDVFVPKIALVSIAHLQDRVDARRNSARYSGAVRSPARCWHGSGPDGGHHASTRSSYPCVDDTIIRIVDRWQVGSFFLGHCRRDIHSQDHGRSHVHKYKNTHTYTVM